MPHQHKGRNDFRVQSIIYFINTMVNCPVTQVPCHFHFQQIGTGYCSLWSRSIAFKKLKVVNVSCDPKRSPPIVICPVTKVPCHFHFQKVGSGYCSLWSPSIAFKKRKHENNYKTTGIPKIPNQHCGRNDFKFRAVYISLLQWLVAP